MQYNPIFIFPPSNKATFENPFFLEVLRGISQFCNQRQYASTIITGQDDTEVIHAISALAHDSRAGGFIVLYSKEDDAIINYLCICINWGDND